MKALLVLAAVAGTAFVGYSYTSTDGQTCAVCPLTGEPLMTTSDSEGSCCASQEDLLLTGIEGEATCTKGCCSEAGENMLTSADAGQCEGCASEKAEGEGSCTKGCCQDKEEMTATEGEETEVPAAIEEIE
ncbi:MAG: hypothetical protein ABJZ55_17140 [Fuerstiella sp.]